MSLIVSTGQAVDVGIAVRDISRALWFYRDVLELEYLRVERLPQGLELHRLCIGRSEVKLLAITPVPPAANPPGGAFTATGYRYLTIRVGNVDEIVRACRTAGVHIHTEPFDSVTHPGERIAMVTDPDGNLLEFVQQRA
jgi:catechol 2,3-dioxygenase-like lactoylglutathione lyase family enzyme